MYEDMEEILRGLELKDIIGYAIGSEEAASNYYHAIVLVFDPNDLVKTKFENISNDEKAHARALLRLHRELFDNEDWSMPDGLPPFESRTDVESVGSLIEALNLAMQNEMSAHKVYTYLAKTHREHRKLFNYLAQTEMGHYETLKQEKGFFDAEVSEDPSYKGLSISNAYNSPLFRPGDVR
jgi:rubrerythrin